MEHDYRLQPIPASLPSSLRHGSVLDKRECAAICPLRGSERVSWCRVHKPDPNPLKPGEIEVYCWRRLPDRSGAPQLYSFPRN